MAKTAPSEHTVDDFLKGKSALTVSLFHALVDAFQQAGDVRVLPAKTMIGIATPRKRIAWVTQLGKDFVHVVFPFEKPYPDNLCFQKIAQVPGDDKQFNHHFRMFALEDLNDEVKKFITLAYREGS